MNKKQAEPDEMRLSAADFDEMLRRALGVPAPDEPKPKPKKKEPKPKAARKALRT